MEARIHRRILRAGTLSPHVSNVQTVAEFSSWIHLEYKGSLGDNMMTEGVLGLLSIGKRYAETLDTECPFSTDELWVALLKHYQRFDPELVYANINAWVGSILKIALIRTRKTKRSMVWHLLTSAEFIRGCESYKTTDILMDIITQAFQPKRMHASILPIGVVSKRIHTKWFEQFRYKRVQSIQPQQKRARVV
jgi:hypothetical protein